MKSCIELPHIKGLVTSNVRLYGNLIMADAEANYAEAIQEIDALLAMFHAATHGADAQDVLNATREAMVCNTCPECGGSKFLRKYYISTRHSRVVDVLHCVSETDLGTPCGNIIEVDRGRPSGLMPCKAAIIKARIAAGNVWSVALQQPRPIEAELAAYH